MAETPQPPRPQRRWRWLALLLFFVLFGLLYAPLKDFGAELYALWR